MAFRLRAGDRRGATYRNRQARCIDQVQLCLRLGRLGPDHVHELQRRGGAMNRGTSALVSATVAAALATLVAPAHAQAPVAPAPAKPAAPAPAKPAPAAPAAKPAAPPVAPAAAKPPAAPAAPK